MNIGFSNFVGIDVSKDKVDMYSTLTSQHLTVENNIKALKKAFGKFDKNTFVVLENTGGYENRCLKVLMDLKIRTHRTNNNMVKNFMLSLGNKAKTDSIDARALSKFGSERHKELRLYEKPTKEQETMRESAKYLYFLKMQRIMEKNHLQSPGCELIKEDIKETIKVLNGRIVEIEKKIDRIIKSDNVLEERVKLLCQYKGIGKRTAIQLLAHLPELGILGRRSVAALSGVAPHANDSGKKTGYRTTKGGGRPIVKRTLFLAALSACRYNESIHSHYTKKTAEQGKKKMVAIVACMRKMIVQLNAAMRDGELKTI